MILAVNKIQERTTKQSKLKRGKKNIQDQSNLPTLPIKFKWFVPSIWYIQQQSQPFMTNQLVS